MLRDAITLRDNNLVGPPGIEPGSLALQASAEMTTLAQDPLLFGSGGGIRTAPIPVRELGYEPSEWPLLYPAIEIWSGRWESNPHLNDGNVV